MSKLRSDNHDQRLITERNFHDRWAESVAVDKIDIDAVNQGLTSPELRYIHRRLGDIRGKRLLDVGCGFGETSVYFARAGAKVTATDLSPGMLALTEQLAARYGTALQTEVGDFTQIEFKGLFDIIHVANLLHHVDINPAVEQLGRLLAPGGVLVVWEPLAYNPVMNIYRRIASAVRTPDEHPLTRADVVRIESEFTRVEKRFFWLTTMFVFVWMFFVQRRSTRERYWKVVIRERDSLRWLYAPLERLDHLLLRLFPPLRWWCWNVLLILRK